MTLPYRDPGPGPRRGEVTASPDAELLARLRAGDVHAFEVLFRRHYAALCRFVAGYTRSLDVAEELVQDLFASFWERRASVAVLTTLDAYLHAAARNRALSHIRRGMVERRWREEVERGQRRTEPVSGPADAAAELEAGELGAVVQGIVARMPERRRLVYTLSRDRHMTYAEIAEVLEISTKTVEIQIGRALQDIRDGLAAEGWDVP